MVPFLLGVAGEMARWQNAASGHKMFIAAGSDFSGGKVRGGKREADEAGVETQTAARLGGGLQ